MFTGLFSLSLSLPPSVSRGFWCQICADLPVANKKAKAISPLDGFLQRDCRRPLPQANTQCGCATNNGMMALASVFDSKVLRVSILLMFGTSLLQATQTFATRKGRMRKRWLQGMTCWLACSAESDGLATDSSLNNLEHMARSLLLSLSLPPALCLPRLLKSTLRRPHSSQQKSKSNPSFGWISPAGLSPSSSPSQYTVWLCNEQRNDGTRKCVRLKSPPRQHLADVRDFSPSSHANACNKERQDAQKVAPRNDMRAVLLVRVRWAGDSCLLCTCA